jgi:small subunit ribosomal protein S36
MALDPAARPATTRLRRSGRVPRFVWAVTGLHVGLMLCFSLLYPPFSQLDEPQHVDAVMSIRYGFGWPAPGHRLFSEGVLEAAQPVVAAEFQPPFSNTKLPPGSKRPSLEQLGVRHLTPSYALPNQMTQHPPAFYALGAGLLAAIPGSGSWPAGLTVEVLRLLSILLVAPLPLLAWATARALRAAPYVAEAAAVVPLVSPQLQRVGAGVNNDALLSVTFAGALLLLVKVAEGDHRRRTALGLGALAGLALLTKGFALALVPAIALAYLVGNRRGVSSPRGPRRPWVLGLLSLAVAFAIGGWWYLVNLLRYGTLQPSGTPAAFKVLVLGKPRPSGSVLTFLDGTYERIASRFWGGLGINYVGPLTYPAWLTDTLVLVTVIGVVSALVMMRRHRWTVAVAVLLPFVSVVAILLAGAWSGFHYNESYPGAQGRYLFAAVPAVGAVVVVGIAALVGRARRLLVPAVVLVALLMQAQAVRYVLKYDWFGTSSRRGKVGRWADGLHGIESWAPFPTSLVWLIGLATAVLAVTVGLAAGWSLVQRSPESCQEVLVDDRDVAGVDRPLDDLQDDRPGVDDGAHHSIG